VKKKLYGKMHGDWRNEKGVEWPTIIRAESGQIKENGGVAGGTGWDV